MKKVILPFLIAAFAISCEKKSNESVTTTTTPADSTVTVPESNEPIQPSYEQTCYMKATGQDSLFVTLDDNLGTITGKMYYKNFQKDSSFGDVNGVQNGDTIKLMYTFESEGMVSDREIYFLRKNGNLIEGIGDSNTEGNTSLYADYSKIQYNDDQTLKQVTCENFEEKFKR